MKTLAQIVLLMALAILPARAGDGPGQSCAPNWTSSDYKSFGDLRTEIKKKFGDVRILRVALCGQGGEAYFQIVIISGTGEVQRVRLAAGS